MAVIAAAAKADRPVASTYSPGSGSDLEGRPAGRPSRRSVEEFLEIGEPRIISDQSIKVA